MNRYKVPAVSPLNQYWLVVLEKAYNRNVPVIGKYKEYLMRREFCVQRNLCRVLVEYT